MFEVIIGIIALSAVLSYLNSKILKISDTIGVMLLSLLMSVVFIIYAQFDNDRFITICSILEGIDFRTILMDFFLGVLLFAGAIHVNVNKLFKEWRSVFTLATVGVLISTFLCGSIFYVLAQQLGIEISYPYSLLFGALISPTDPIAVIALLKKANTPDDLQTKIIGESLFNDGVGIVVFLSILSIATMPDQAIDSGHIMVEFIKEVGGGIGLGIVLGFIGVYLISRLKEEPIIAVHISLALVLGGYSLASSLHFSGALAMVVAGLMIGNKLHGEKIDKLTKDHFNTFWKVLDEILNSALFVMIGMVAVSLTLNMNHLALALISIFIVLISRFIAIGSSNILLPGKDRSDLKEITILTWAGLRGGISIALVLSLAEGPIKEILLTATFVIVAFSIVVQGLSIEKFVNRILKI